MFLRTASFLQFPHGRYSENLVARDEDTIRNLYQSNGFRDVEVTHRSQDDYQGQDRRNRGLLDDQGGAAVFHQ